MLYERCERTAVCKHARFASGSPDGARRVARSVEGMRDFGLAARMASDVASRGIDCDALVGKTEDPVFEKFDRYLPPSLLRKAYATDKLRADEAERRIGEIYREFLDATGEGGGAGEKET